MTTLGFSSKKRFAYRLGFIFILVASYFFLCVVPAFARSTPYQGEVAGWIPWWQDTAGLQSATAHISKLDIVYPFVYEVNSIGQITDKANLSEPQWQNFFSVARKNNVKIIPTILWTDGNAMQSFLHNDALRSLQVKLIVVMVAQGKFDGINIDYEQKKAESMADFSKFLTELDAALGKQKLLTCAVEARTPAQDLYTVVPSPLRYANDYSVIAKHCDRIELMTYDQQRADLTLDKVNQGSPYAPVADTAWVEKVVKLALNTFPSNRVFLGIPTYGRAWDVTVSPDWFQSYQSVATINFPHITTLLTKYKVTPGRASGGEATFTYFPDDSVYTLLNALPVPKGTVQGTEAAAKALLFVNSTKSSLPVRYLTYSDAVTVKSRLDLAARYNLHGIALFKIDGEEDPNIWKLF